MAPFELEADASSSAAPEGTTLETYLWSFGDQDRARGVSVRHLYEAPGRYPFFLCVASADGRSSTRAWGTAKATCPSGDVEPWTSVGVGEALLPGSAWKAGEDLHVCAGGSDITASRDEFQFVHRELAGNFAIVAQVLDVPSWGAAGLLGLMVRESLDPGSRHASILLQGLSTTPAYRFRYRTAQGSATRTRTATGTPPIPGWFRLERRGDEFVALMSTDGSAWEELHRETIAGFPQVLLAGVAACGKDPGVATSQFLPLRARLSTPEVLPLDPSFVRGDANADRVVDISDAVAVLGSLFLGTALNDCEDAADANDDGAVDISDPVRVLGHLFLGTEPPPAPSGSCGGDSTADDLGCSTFRGCP